LSALARFEKRSGLAIGVAIALLSVLSAGLASRALAPAFGELPRLAALDNAERLVREIAGTGFGALSAAKLRALSPDADAPPALVLLFAAWARVSLGRLGILDPLICARLPWLVASALGPLLVYAIVLPSRGRLAAVLAAALLLFQPRWLHAAGVATGPAALSGVWLLAIALYLRSQVSGRRRLCWAAGAAIAIGAAAALSLATLWLAVLLLLHHFAAHWGSVRRLLRRGRVPVPAALILAVPLGPLVFFLCRPELVSENAITTLRGLFAVLAPSVQETLFHGRVAGAVSAPVLAYAVTALIWTLPTTLLVAVALGFGAIVEPALARRFASGRLRPERDRRALGALVVLGTCVSSIAPAVAPAPLLVFPPRLELVLPFLAIAAALGVEVAARRAAGAPRAWAPAGLIVAMLAWQSLREPATIAAAYAPLFGGAESVSKRRLFALGDGSELGALARRLDALAQVSGRRPSAGLPDSPALAVDAPDIPEGFWQALKRHGRIKASVTRSPGTPLRVERGAGRGRAVAVVERDGAALWSLLE